MFEGDGCVKEYVGGYGDWVRQRDTEKVISKSDTAGKRDSGARKRPKETGEGRPKKLSFNEQRELDQLPAAIEALESEQRELGERISRPDFYKESADEIRAALARVDEMENELAGSYARWDELDSRTK